MGTIADVFEARRENWLAMLNAGLSLREIARRADVSHGTVARAIGQHDGALLRKRASTKHGARRTPEYRIWSGIIDRCTNPKARKYPRYGGRGIWICDQWRHDFAAFLADMGPKPSPLHSIDRIDNDGPYSPENCRWATAREQQNNRCNNTIIEAYGHRRTLAEWSRRTGLGPSTITRRLGLGWSADEAVSRPLRGSR